MSEILAFCPGTKLNVRIVNNVTPLEDLTGFTCKAASVITSDAAVIVEQKT